MAQHEAEAEPTPFQENPTPFEPPGLSNEEYASTEPTPFEAPYASNDFSTESVEPYVVHGEEMPAEVSVEMPPAHESQPEESAYDFSQTLDAIPEVAIAPGGNDTADFSDVTDFANATSEVGPFSYTVVIEGIESSQLLLQLKEAITDSRFGWDVGELLHNVGGGRLVIGRISPATASVLVNQLKYLPLKISWRQDVLSGS